MSAAGATREHARTRWQRRPELLLDHAIRQGRAANNFDLLRLVGAGLVLFAHSFALTRTTEPLPSFMHLSWGEVGVVVFFSISGFLIARSWAYDPKPLSFAVKRGLRLMPALVVSLLLTALVLGALASTLSLDAYLENPGTKAYVINNATFQTNYALPGVFGTTPYPSAVNGSLWTLPLELKAYFLVLALGLLGLFGRRRLLMPLVAVFLAALAVNSLRAAIPYGDHMVAMLMDIQAPPALVAQAGTGALQEYARLFAAFAIGASLFSVARWVPLRWSVGGALAVAWTAANVVGGADASDRDRVAAALRRAAGRLPHGARRTPAGAPGRLLLRALYLCLPGAAGGGAVAGAVERLGDVPRRDADRARAGGRVVASRGGAGADAQAAHLAAARAGWDGGSAPAQARGPAARWAGCAAAAGPGSRHDRATSRWFGR
ncbi:MAG: acyltransferase family protein [Conexibacter sp.]